MTDSPKMFADKESVAAALKQLHPEIAEAVTPKEFDETVAEMVAEGAAAEQIGRSSLIKIFASFVCEADRFEGLEALAEMPEEEAEDDWTKILQKLAKSGLTAEELTYFVRQLQFELLDDVCLSLDNNVTYDHVPYSEFGVYLINTHSNEPEVLIDGLHECVEEIKEEVGHEES